MAVGTPHHGIPHDPPPAPGAPCPIGCPQPHGEVVGVCPQSWHGGSDSRGAVPGVEGRACLQPRHCAGGSGLALLSHGASGAERWARTLQGGPGPYRALHTAGTGGCEPGTADPAVSRCPPCGMWVPNSLRTPRSPLGPHRHVMAPLWENLQGEGRIPPEGEVPPGGVCRSLQGGLLHGGGLTQGGAFSPGVGVSPGGWFPSWKA